MLGVNAVYKLRNVNWAKWLAKQTEAQGVKQSEGFAISVGPRDQGSLVCIQFNFSKIVSK